MRVVIAAAVVHVTESAESLVRDRTVEAARAFPIAIAAVVARVAGGSAQTRRAMEAAAAEAGVEVDMIKAKFEIFRSLKLLIVS